MNNYEEFPMQIIWYPWTRLLAKQLRLFIITEYIGLTELLLYFCIEFMRFVGTHEEYERIKGIKSIWSMAQIKNEQQYEAACQRI